MNDVVNMLKNGGMTYDDTLGSFTELKPEGLVRVEHSKESEKNIEKRLWELKEKYDSANDFDLITILKLEDEYTKLTSINPEHTKRRREILDMRCRLLMNCRYKSK